MCTMFIKKYMMYIVSLFVSEYIYGWEVDEQLAVEEMFWGGNNWYTLG